MDTLRKNLLRAAVSIRTRLDRATRGDQVQLPLDTWQRLERLTRQMNLARRLNYQMAIKTLYAELADEASYLCSNLQVQAGDWKQETHRSQPFSHSEIFRELLALHEEYQEVTCDVSARILSVRTRPVVLEDISFGPFQIALDWNQLGRDRAYRVIALEPHPAGSDESVTHPHIKNERLCEGDGYSAIRAALNSGRLCDFFLIVTQTLSTYSVGNAYVELRAWNGESCRDCDVELSEDDTCFCHGCDTVLCGECLTSCGCCRDGHCSRCMSDCHDCETSHCQACIQSCSRCGHPYCPDCLDDQHLCQECREEGESNDDDSDLSNTDLETDRALAAALASANPDITL